MVVGGLEVTEVVTLAFSLRRNEVLLAHTETTVALFQVGDLYVYPGVRVILEETLTPEGASGGVATFAVTLRFADGGLVLRDEVRVRPFCCE